LKTVILAGGKGTRYDSTQPKALAIIGGMPIIHHIMEIYHRQGYSDFIVALGWQKEYIAHYFKNGTHHYNITFVDTGENTNTGERIKRIETYISEARFFATYCDGLGNVNLNALEARHIASGNIATLTAVRPEHQYGILSIDSNNKVTAFSEKPRMQEYINGGFFIFDRNIFRHIKQGDSLESDVLQRLIPDKLGAYRHEGFWDTLNTPKDEQRLNELYEHRMKENKIIDWLDVE
jgi:glucose-1-phosphate cytidylyltransferase